MPKSILDMVERHENHPTPNIEQARAVNIGTDETPREVKIGAELSSEQGKAITNLLIKYQDIFAWSYQDMPELNTDIVEHYLPLKAGCKPVKQKLRKLKPTWALQVRNEVMKQWEAGFLKVVSLLSNMVDQYHPSPKERRESQNVCRLQGSEQSKSER